MIEVRVAYVSVVVLRLEMQMASTSTVGAVGGGRNSGHELLVGCCPQALAV